MKENGKILFIEDDPEFINVYMLAIKAANINTEIINSGTKGVEKIKEINDGKSEKPDLVLLDLILPDINGIEVLKEIRKNENTRDMAVFVLSNYTNSRFLEQGVQPDKFILKAGITPTELVRIIKEKFKKI